MGLPEGTRLGSHEVLASMGIGGGGELYRARDTKLNREVAIRVLPEAFTRDRDCLARFEREARLLASLNHPHIEAIYSLEESQGMYFLVLEQVLGETLAQKVERGGLPMEEVLLLFKQIAEALEAAHHKGVVHRELTPAQIKVTPEGRAKVLDFGLNTSLAAEKAEAPPLDVSQSPTAAQWPTVARDTKVAELTETTVPYVSPEQARGGLSDARTDIWAFGCCLYEALAGRRAFSGQTAADTLAKILEREPDWHSLPLDAPPAVVRLLRRCLEKDFRDRHQDIAAARAEIEEALRQLKKPTGFLPAARIRRRAGRIVSGVALLLLVGSLFYLIGPEGSRAPQLMNPIRVTAASGVEDYPTWSSDGRTLAYSAAASDWLGNGDIWVVQIGGGPPVNRTADDVHDDRCPSWSPDGLQIAFWSSRDGGGCFVMPALGGAPRRIIATGLSTDASSPPQWSADGSRLACVGYEPSRAFIEIVSLRTEEALRIPLPSSKDVRRRFYDLSWSPDGRFFAYVASASLKSDLSQLWVLDAEQGAATAVTEGWTNDWSPSWSADGRTLYFVSNRGGNLDLWEQPIGKEGRPDGAPRAVSVGIGIRHAAFSPDGRKLAYSQGRRVANVWRVPILSDRRATWADAQQVTFDETHAEHVDMSPDGRNLIVSSDRSGNKDLWILPVEQDVMRQLTTDPTPDWFPVWSPDGLQMAFYSFRSGNRDIWVMPVGGAPARQITERDATDVQPAWSPDGRQIAFYSDAESDDWEIWVVAARGGEPRRVTEHPADDMNVAWSPDGKWLTFQSDRTGVSRLWRIPAEGGEAEPLTAGPAYFPRWSSDGKRVFFTGYAERAGDLWALTIEDGSERPLTDLAGRPGSLGTGSLATNGSELFFTWEEFLGDLWVADVSDSSRK